MDDNIERFNYHTGLVFACLYKAFPQRVDIDPRAIGLEEEQPDWDQEQFLRWTVQWLHESGYISAGWPAEARQVVLSAKGLEVLKAIPASLEAGASIGDQIVDCTRAGSKAAIADLTSRALTGGLRMIWEVGKASVVSQ